MLSLKKQQNISLTPGSEILVGTFAYRFSASHFISEHRAQQNLPEKKGVRTLSMKACRGACATQCQGPLKGCCPWPLVSALSGDILRPRFSDIPKVSAGSVIQSFQGQFWLRTWQLPGTGYFWGCGPALGRMMKGVHISLKQKTPLL